MNKTLCIALMAVAVSGCHHQIKEDVEVVDKEEQQNIEVVDKTTEIDLETNGSTVSEWFSPASKDDQYHYFYTAKYGNEGRGGAAIRKPGVIHVLSKKDEADLIYSADQLAHIRGVTENRPIQLAKSTLTPGDLAQLDDDISKLTSDKDTTEPDSNTDIKPEPISDELRAVYEKYCKGGKDMTDADWEMFEQAGGAKTVPADLANSCIHPK